MRHSPLVKWLALWPLPPSIALFVLMLAGVGGEAVVLLAVGVLTFSLYYLVALGLLWLTRWATPFKVVVATLTPISIAIALWPIKIGGGFLGPMPATVYMAAPVYWTAQAIHDWWNPPLQFPEPYMPPEQTPATPAPTPDDRR